MALLEVIFAVGLLFEVGNSQKEIDLYSQPDKDVTLPCGSQNQPQQCSDVSWFYNRDSSGSSSEAQRGEIDQTSPRADRMSLGIDCSLAIKNVTAEDAGRFTCRQRGHQDVSVYLNLLSRTRCKTTAKADIVLLVDDSGSISSKDFRTIRRFIADIVGMFDIGPDRVQIGLTQYSDNPKTQWHLNTHRTKESLLNDVNKLQQIGGFTKTGRALTHILENNFQPNVGMREDSRKIGILFTDGESQDDVIMPSQNLRDNGIELYTIGVGDADLKELKSIASDPHDTHVYYVNDSGSLLDIITSFTDNLCDSIKGPDWSPLSSIMLVLRISALVLMIMSTVLVFNLRGNIKPRRKETSMHEDVIEADYENDEALVLLPSNCNNFQIKIKSRESHSFPSGPQKIIEFRKCEENV